MFSEVFMGVVISTGHLSKEDMAVLSELSGGMVSERDAGYLVQLYEEPEHNKYKDYSKQLNSILLEASRAGFRFVDFDADGPVIDGLEEF